MTKRTRDDARKPRERDEEPEIVIRWPEQSGRPVILDGRHRVLACLSLRAAIEEPEQ